MAPSRLLRYAAIPILFAGLSARPAHAVNRDIVQLQTQVQQLQDALARLQQSNDESMGVLKDLVQQTVDSVNKMSVAINGMGLKLQNAQDASAATSTQLSGQIQSLNDSLDELKARMDHMQTALAAIQSQEQSANAALANITPPAGSAIPAGSGIPAESGNPAPPSGGATIPPTAETGGPPATAVAPEAPAGGSGAAGTFPAVPSAPASGEMYSTAYSDYIAGKYPLASSEFNELIKAYPDDNLSGNAYFYLGEIDMRTNRPSAAIRNYDRVLEHYPDNAKIPAAQLHKGQALIAMHQNEAGIRELRALIQRYPVSPEASQARSKLNAMGVTIRARG